MSVTGASVVRKPGVKEKKMKKVKAKKSVAIFEAFIFRFFIHCTACFVRVSNALIYFFIIIFTEKN